MNYNTILPPFKWFVLQNFPYIEDDFDALTNWQLFCKLGKEMNQIIEKTNLTGEQVENLTNAFNTLKAYVDDYFENLDVQEEINNKLDELVENGTLESLIGPYIQNDVLPLISQQNERITTAENNIQNIDNTLLENQQQILSIDQTTIKQNESSSITMPMLSQEVLEAITGGSTAVVGENSVDNVNIKDKAVSLYKLEDLLQENYIPEFENVEFTRNLQGYGKVNSSTNKIEIDTTAGYTYAIVNLQKDTYYNMTALNFYNVCGIIIADANDNVILSTRPQSTVGDGYTPVNLNFRCNQSGLICYITGGTTEGWVTEKFRQEQIQINKLTSIKINKRAINFQPIKTIAHRFVSWYSSVNNQPSILGDDASGGTIKLYKISKGTKYHVSSAMYSYIAPLVLTDEKFNILFVKKGESVPQPMTPFSYDFTCQANGYMLISDFDGGASDSYTSVVNIIQENTEELRKNWTAIGDSLTATSTLGVGVNTYAENVAEDLSLNLTKVAYGGIGYKAGAYNNAFYLLSDTDLNNPDIITIFGSFNDTFSNYDIGNITDNTSDTILGCVNITLNNLQENYPNARVGIILPSPWSNRNSYNATSEEKTIAENYVNALKELCEARNVPYLDLYTKSNLYPWDLSFRTLFYKEPTDGVHPNANGHLRFTNQIKEFIKSL